MSADTVTVHYEQYHQSSVDSLNKAFESQNFSLSTGDILQQIKVSAEIKTYMGAHINHCLFFENLAHPSSPDVQPASGPLLLQAIEQRWGNFARFREEMSTKSLSVLASGFAWLTVDEESGALEIMITKDNDMVPQGKVPLIAIDMWEHAYFLQYRLNRAAYVDSLWYILNWKVADQRLRTVGTSAP